MTNLIWIPIIGLTGLLFAFFIYKSMMKRDPGNEKMKEISLEIQKGAMIFLSREYKIIAIFMAVVFVVLAIFIGLGAGIAYLGGAIASLLAGYFGMTSATRSSGRTCRAAQTGGTSQALLVSFLGGSVMGISVAALGVI